MKMQSEILLSRQFPHFYRIENKKMPGGGGGAAQGGKIDVYSDLVV